jgi:predicted nucleic acid-binding protein
MIFIDTNVLIDVLDNDPVWAEWSRLQLIAAAGLGAVAINDVVYAELAVGFASVARLDAAVEELRLILSPISRAALFLAAKAFTRYRASGGTRTGILPDFLIGAQALAADAELITRDPRRYRAYFPQLPLISPALN